MTGVGEFAAPRVISAAPERIRVSVFGGRTQLDIALPLDVPVSGFVPDLARLVRSRDLPHGDEDPAVKDERRTFWVLSRFDTGVEVRPEQTLRDAGVENGELLRLSPERALSPPPLYDDVVDAAARLNKAAYAAWDAHAARWMAFAGTHLAVWAFVFCLLRGVFDEQRVLGAALAGVVVVTLVGVAAVTHRSYGWDDVAAALGWAAIPLTAAIVWTMLARYGGYWIAVSCAVLLVLNAIYFRLIGTGHWAYLAASVLTALGGIAVLAHAAGVGPNIVCVTAAVGSALMCLLIPRLTVRLDRFEPPTVRPDTDRDEWDFENPFEEAKAAKPAADEDSGTTMPTAETVWARVRWAALSRSALLAALAAATAAAVVVLLRDSQVGWPALVFALACAAVLGLRSRAPDTWVERCALAVPALVLLVATCVLAHSGRFPIPVVALWVLLTVAVAAATAGMTAPPRRLTALLAYLEYLAVASLVPLGLWVVGIYERLGRLGS